MKLIRFPFIIAMLACLSTLTVHAQAQWRLDSTFAQYGIAVVTHTGYTHRPMRVTELPDGKIMLAGYNSEWGNMETIRLNSNGTVDSTYNGIGASSMTIAGTFMTYYATVTKPNGKTYFGGVMDYGISSSVAAVCFKADGTPDSSFGTNGMTLASINNWVTAPQGIDVQSDGKVIVTTTTVNSSGIYQYAAIRFLTNGNVDNTYGSGGIVTCPYASINTPPSGVIANRNTQGLMQPDDKMLVAGLSTFPGPGAQAFLVRYKQDGTPDSAFGASGIVLLNIANVNLQIQAAAMDPSNNIYIGMIYSNVYGGVTDTNIAVVKFDSTGNLVSSFGGTGMITVPTTLTNASPLGPNAMLGLAVQNDGKVLVQGYTDSASAGMFTTYRFTASGNLDTSFGNNGRFTVNRNAMDQSFAISMQADGKILLAGYDSSSASAVCMRLTDGRTTSIKNINEAQVTFTVYPNPSFTGTYTISYNNQNNIQRAMLELYDVAGKLIKTTPVRLNAGTGKLDYTLPENIAYGSYYLHIIFPDGQKQTVQLTHL